MSGTRHVAILEQPEVSIWRHVPLSLLIQTALVNIKWFPVIYVRYCCSKSQFAPVLNEIRRHEEVSCA